MPATGAHLKVRRMGDDVLGVELEGNPKKPEPDHFRVVFPGGDVDIARHSDGSYWIHVAVNRPGRGLYDPEAPTGQLLDGRVDVEGKSASETSAGDLSNPAAYHVAVRVAAKRTGAS